MAKPVKHGDKWRVRWVDEKRERQSAVFDDYKSAQTALCRRQIEIEEIRRGVRNPAPPDKTLNDLCDYWLEKRAPRKRSGKDDKSIIKQLRVALGGKKLRDIGVEDGDDYLLDRDHLSEKTLANHITLLITMMRTATTFKVPWLLNVPKFNKPKIALFSRDYHWLRSDEEIRRFLASARDDGEHVFVLFAMAIYTGMRAGELAALEWSLVDFDRRIIAVHGSFDGPTKSNRVRYVPILDPLLPILRAWRLRHPGRLVFTNRDGAMLAPSSRIYQEVLHRVLAAAKFPLVERGGKTRPYIRFHDLRHTFASHWAMRGGDMFKLQRILGHQSVQMTMRYAHLAPDAFKDDYGRLGAPIAVAGGEVVELKKQAPVALPAADRESAAGAERSGTWSSLQGQQG
jgi:integrase